MGGSVEIVEFLIFEVKANPTTKCNVRIICICNVHRAELSIFCGLSVLHSLVTVCFQENLITPLHTAAWRGSLEVAKVLLKHADVNINELSKVSVMFLDYCLSQFVLTKETELHLIIELDCMRLLVRC